LLEGCGCWLGVEDDLAEFGQGGGVVLLQVGLDAEV